MNSLMIFTDELYLRITILGFFFVLGSGLFLCSKASDSAFITGIKYLLAAICVDFISIWFVNQIDNLEKKIAIEILIYGELLLKLGVSLLACVSATKIMLGNVKCGMYIGSLGIVEALTALYFVMIEPNGSVAIVLQSLLPAMGFAYLSAAYFTRCFRRHKSGSIVGFLSMVMITYNISKGIWPENVATMQPWCIGILEYCGLGLSFLLSFINEQEDKLNNAQQSIEKYNQRMKEIIRLSPFPIIISKLSDDSILLANDNFLKLFSLKNTEINNYKFRDFFVDADNRRLLNVHLEKDKIVKDFEILVKAPSETTPFWLSTSANIIDYDYDIAIYAAFQDITDRKKREKILQTQATRDPLTSLYNRRYFEEEVNRKITQNPNQAFSIFMIDADHFKRINDTYGHKTGDEVLIALASTAEKALRENDIVARYGGEEFIVFLAQSNEQEALAVANRLRESIAKIEVHSDAGEKIKFTVSIGIALSQASQNLDTLIKMSDDALYKAKETGRNKCVVYRSDMRQASSQKKEQENIHPAFAKNNDVEISLLGSVSSTPLEEK